MATLKLLSQPKNIDGSHRIASPGGYEFWHFYAEDSSRRLRVVATYHDGFVFHPIYKKRYAAYRRNPTRHSPPTPSEYPCAQVSIYENGKSLGNSTKYFPASSFQSAEDGSIALDSDRVAFNDDQIKLTISRPDLAMSLELNFEETLPITPREQSFPSDTGSNTDYCWIPARALCNVRGEVRRNGRIIPFDGMGTHNHYFGTGPISSETSRWLRGYILFPLAAELFQATPDQALLFSADESGSRVSDGTPLNVVWKKSLFGDLQYPSEISFGDRLILRNPKPVWKIRPQLQLIYDAYVAGEQTTAWVELDYF